ncbi:11584_t:CDS:2 [Acaulospora colombiana]|uniref:11584_t:CDS:1 n=1 Tax=Acaulospora colombiana TaxID=27376 RepID=A0ACA9LCU5_9GLOM|nr:11584_t:CDS:2 [Acaulospora colombiana]
MLALGSKVLDRPQDLEVAIRLAETCYWSYRITMTGIGAEEVWFKIMEEGNLKNNNNPEIHKRHPDGIIRLGPSYYLLRPETIESLFILYRVTGDKKYQEHAWEIWQSIEKWCKTSTGYSGIYDVDSTSIIKNDSMER